MTNMDTGSTQNGCNLNLKEILDWMLEKMNEFKDKIAGSKFSSDAVRR